MKGSYRKIHPLSKKSQFTAGTVKLPPISKDPALTTKKDSGNMEGGDLHEPQDQDQDDDQQSEASVEIIRFYRSKLASASKADIQYMRATLLTQMPVYRQSRLTRTSPEDRVVFDLHEQGFIESAKYLKGLFDFERESRQAEDSVANSNNWPWLYKQEALLDVIVAGLREAEVARRHRRRLLELSAWLHIAVFAALRKTCWYWVADRLFKKCIGVAKFLQVGLRREACVRFTYAQFLLVKLNLNIEALYHFNIVRRMTRKRQMEGVDLLELSEYEGDLHSQSCYYMYKVCIALAIQLRPTNPTMSVKLCRQAQGFIQIACHGWKGIAQACDARGNAVFELIQSLIAAKEYSSAIAKLNVYQMFCKRNLDVTGFCKTLFLRAQCFQCIKKRKLAAGDYRMLCKVAEKWGGNEYYTTSVMEFSELTVTGAKTSLLNVLKNAAHAFLTCHNSMERDIRQRSRCLIGIAEGQYIWPDFLKMIVATETDREQLKKLVEWKANRTPFVPNQLQSFIIQIPKRVSPRESHTFLHQIQKFILPEKLLAIHKRRQSLLKRHSQKGDPTK